MLRAFLILLSLVLILINPAQAATAEQLARARHSAGASDLLELLDAQRSAQQSQAGFAQGLAQQRLALVDVLRALGASAPGEPG